MTKKNVRVRAHVRRVDGRKVPIKAHNRNIELNKSKIIVKGNKFKYINEKEIEEEKEGEEVYKKNILYDTAYREKNIGSYTWDDYMAHIYQLVSEVELLFYIGKSDKTSIHEQIKKLAKESRTSYESDISKVPINYLSDKEATKVIRFMADTYDVMDIIVDKLYKTGMKKIK